MKEVEDNSSEGWTWQSLPAGGVLTLRQSTGNQIEIRD